MCERPSLVPVAPLLRIRSRLTLTVMRVLQDWEFDAVRWSRRSARRQPNEPLQPAKTIMPRRLSAHRWPINRAAGPIALWQGFQRAHHRQSPPSLPSKRLSLASSTSDAHLRRTPCPIQLADWLRPPCLPLRLWPVLRWPILKFQSGPCPSTQWSFLATIWGFRMTARKGGTPVGQLVVRVDGQWKEVEFSFGVRP